MRTVQDWLAIPKNKLPTALAEVLTPGPWKHEYRLAINKKEFVAFAKGCAKNSVYPKWYCTKCVQVVEKQSDRYEDRHLLTISELPDDCSVPDPTKIKDRNTAIQLIRKLFVTPRQQADFITELVDICDEAPIDYLESEPSFMLWLLFVANVRELLIAAALATERKE